MSLLSLLSSLDRIGFDAMRLVLGVLWQSSILLVVIGVLAWALRRRRASVRHTLWVAALLAGPLLPLVGAAAFRSGAPQAPVPILPTYTAPAVRPDQRFASTPSAPAVRPTMPIPAENEAAPQEEAGVSVFAYPWAMSLMAYAIGLAAFLIWIALGRIRIRRWIRSAILLTEARAVSAFRSARETVVLRKDFLLLESDRVPTALSFGVFHPVVLLPKGLAQSLSDDELHAVAVHELAHIKRKDAAVLMLVSLLRAALFFHPLVWLAARQISTLAEQAADDAVLEAGGEPISYAKMLARLAEDLPRHAFSAELAAGILLGKNTFLRRVEAILSDRRDQIRKLTRIALAGTVIAALLSLAVALAVPLGEKASSSTAKAGEDTRDAAEAPESQIEYEPAESIWTRGSLEVHVLGIDGKPMDKFAVKLYRVLRHGGVWKANINAPNDLFRRDYDGRGRWSRDRTLGSDPQGASNPLGTWKKLPSGKYRLEARAGDGQGTPFGTSEVFRVRRGKNTVITIRLQDGPALSVRPVDAETGKPIEQATFWIVRDDGFTVVRGWPRNQDRDDVLLLADIPPGVYWMKVHRRVRLWKPNWREYELPEQPTKVEILPGEDKKITIRLKGRDLTQAEVEKRWPWIAEGRVTDENGRGMKGVEIAVFCGWGTIPVTGKTLTDGQGKYRVRFKSGGLVWPVSSGVSLWAANVTAWKPGYTEKNQSRHGYLYAGLRLPAENESREIDPDKVILPSTPRHIDFVMVPDATADTAELKTGNSTSEPAEEAMRPPDAKAVGPVVEDGVVFGIWLDKLVWDAAEAPVLKAMLSHRGKRDLPRLGQYHVQVDGEWYSETWGFDARARVFQTNHDYQNMEYTLDNRWRNEQHGNLLSLAPGRHLIRVAFDTEVPDSAPETGVRITSNVPELRKKRMRIMSNIVAFRLLGPGEEATEDEWFELAADGRPGSRYSAEQVADIHRKEHGQELPPAELAALYAKQAMDLAQTGPNPALLADTIERALAFDQEDLTRLRLYVFLGDAYQRQTRKSGGVPWARRRRIAAEAYFLGLRDVLRHDLPAEPPERPGYADGYILDSPATTTREYPTKRQREAASGREAKRVRELVKYRQVLTGQIVQIYAGGAASEELRQLCLKHIGSEEAADKMVNAAKTLRTDPKAPMPVISAPQRADTAPDQEADRVAPFMKVYDAEGVSIEAGFIPDETSIILGKPLFITFTLINRSDKTYEFSVGGDNRGSVRHNSFRLTAVDTDGQVVRDPYSYEHHGGFGGNTALRPGQTYMERLYLSHWCAFEKPGIYTVTCKRTLNESARASTHPTLPVVSTFKLEILPFDQERVRNIIADLGEQVRRAQGQPLYEATLALAAIRDEQVIPHLAVSLTKGDYQNQRPAVEGLSRFSSDAAADALLQALKSPDHSVRAGAGSALREIKKVDRALAPLLRELEDEKPSVRALAARAVGATKADRALAPLIKTMDDPEPTVRHAAAMALGELGSAEALGPLKLRLEDDDVAMRVAVVKGLRGLGQPLQVEWLTPVIRATTGANDPSFHEAIRLIRLHGGENAARGLVGRLDFDDPSVRNSRNMYLILAIEYCPNGPKYYRQYRHDPNSDGTPEQVAANRRILAALKAWLKDQEKRPDPTPTGSTNPAFPPAQTERAKGIAQPAEEARELAEKIFAEVWAGRDREANILLDMGISAGLFDSRRKTLDLSDIALDAVYADQEAALIVSNLLPAKTGPPQVILIGRAKKEGKWSGRFFEVGSAESRDGKVEQFFRRHPQSHPMLEFRLVDESAAKDGQPMEDAQKKETLYVARRALLTERDLKSASFRPETLPNAEETWMVVLNLTPSGSAKFAEITEKNLGRRLAVVFKGKLLSAPVIRTRISSDHVVVLLKDREEAERIARALNQSLASSPSGSSLAFGPLIKRASFKTLTFSMRSTMAYNRTLTIQSGGDYAFGMETAPREGKGYHAAYRLKPEHLAELDKRVRATNWLTAPGAHESRNRIDGTKYLLTATRDEGKASVVCYGDQPQVYEDLIRFLRRIDRQEWLLYQLTTSAELRRHAVSDISGEIRAVQGAPGTGRPYAPVLDYQRFVPTFVETLSGDEAKPRDELIAAVRVMDIAQVASMRGRIAELALDDDFDHESALQALVRFDVEKAIPVLRELLLHRGSLRSAAAWDLIQLGVPALPVIVEGIESGRPRDDAHHEALIRAYIDHWPKVAKPVDDRVVQAVRNSMRNMQLGNGRIEYHREFLRLVGAPEPRLLNARQTAEETLKALVAGRETPLIRWNGRDDTDAGHRDTAEKALGDLSALRIERVVVDKYDALAVTDIARGPDGPRGRLILYLGRDGVVWKLGAMIVEPPEHQGDYLERFLAKHPEAKELPPARGGDDVSFGPMIEMILRSKAGRVAELVDLETGRRAVNEHFGEDDRETHDWVRKEKLDVLGGG